MGLLQQLKHDLKAGWVSLRYGTARAADRALAEAERLSLRLELRKLDERHKELCRDIGERAIELHERGELAEQVAADYEIGRRIEDVRQIGAARAKLLAEMEEIRPGV